MAHLRVHLTTGLSNAFCYLRRRFGGGTNTNTDTAVCAPPHAPLASSGSTSSPSFGSLPVPTSGGDPPSSRVPPPSFGGGLPFVGEGPSFIGGPPPPASGNCPPSFDGGCFGWDPFGGVGGFGGGPFEGDFFGGGGGDCDGLCFPQATEESTDKVHPAVLGDRIASVSVKEAEHVSDPERTVLPGVRMSYVVCSTRYVVPVCGMWYVVPGMWYVVC